MADERLLHSSKQEQLKSGEVAHGVLLVLVVNTIAFFCLLGLGLTGNSEALLGAGIWIGATQLLYVVPLILAAQRNHNSARVKGLIIGAAITALINIPCSVNFNL